jgi:hypothetical protein
MLNNCTSGLQGLQAAANLAAAARLDAWCCVEFAQFAACCDATTQMHLPAPLHHSFELCQL